MGNLKKLISILLAVLFSVTLLAGCTGKPANSGQAGGDQNKDGKKKTIGVLMADFSDQFQVYVMDGMKEAASKLQNIDVVYMDAKYDPQKQMSQAENLIAQKVDAIVLFVVDREAGKSMIEEINKAGIPIIAVNRKLPDESKGVAYVGSDDINAGEIQAEQMAKLLNGKGNIAVLDGTYGHEPQIRRGQGYENILKKYPDMKIVVKNTGDWYRDKAMKLVENWIQSKIKIDGILANNDEMALGAIKALEDAGLLGKVVVSGIDATPEALEYVKAGKENYTVFQDAKGQGRKSIEVAAKVVNGEKVDKEYIIPFELVTKDKVEEYAKRYK